MQINFDLDQSECRCMQVPIPCVYLCLCLARPQLGTFLNTFFVISHLCKFTLVSFLEEIVLQKLRLLIRTVTAQWQKNFDWLKVSGTLQDHRAFNENLYKVHIF